MSSPSLKTIPITQMYEVVSRQKFLINNEKRPHFCPPGVGHWGMVKMAMLVPEISVLFVIPMGCGRHGGVATMREGLAEKLSYLPIAEVDIVTGNHLEKTEKAVAELIKNEKPKGIMLFTTCIDDLLGSDYDSLFMRLEERHGIPIVRGKMNPIMSLSRKPPAMMIYNSIHSFLKPLPKKKGQYNIIGTPCPINPQSEIHEIMEKAGLPPLRHIGHYSHFEDHLEMAESEGNILINLPGLRAVENMEKKLGQSFHRMFSLTRPEGIRNNYRQLGEYLGRELEFSRYEDELKLLLEESRPALEGKTAVIGMNILAAPFELARLLTETGMDVRYISAGFVRPYEREDMLWLAENAPQLQVIPSVEPSLSLVTEPLAAVDYGVGLDSAAYFDARCLIDISVDENLFGYRGTAEIIRKLLNAKPNNLTIKELVYSQNLVV